MNFSICAAAASEVRGFTPAVCVLKLHQKPFEIRLEINYNISKLKTQTPDYPVRRKGFTMSQKSIRPDDITDYSWRRIDKPAEDKLRSYVAALQVPIPEEIKTAILTSTKRKVNEYSTEGLTAEQLRTVELIKFFKDYDRGTSRIKVKDRRLCYHALPQLLKIAGLSYKDFLELVAGEDGVPAQLRWASATEEKMCTLCDRLNAKERNEVYALILRCLPDKLKELLFAPATTGNKLFDAAECHNISIDEIWQKIKLNPDAEAMGDKSNIDYMLSNIYLYRKDPMRSCDLLPLGDIPRLCEIFDVSMHWVLSLDKHTCILAKKGETEVIMDAFCLLPATYQTFVYNCVKAAF